MKFNRPVAVLLAAILLTGGLAACSQQPASSAPAEDGVTEPAAAAERANTPQTGGEADTASGETVAPEITADGQVTITFPFEGGDGQLAVWIEGEDGSFIQTLAVAGESVALPAWSASSGGKKGDGDEAPSAPSAGTLTYTWDCKDESGNPVSFGSYTFCIEGVGADGDRTLYSGAIAVGTEKSTAEGVLLDATEENASSGVVGTPFAQFDPQ